MILLEACDAHSPPAVVGFGNEMNPRNAEYETAHTDYMDAHGMLYCHY